MHSLLADFMMSFQSDQAKSGNRQESMGDRMASCRSLFSANCRMSFRLFRTSYSEEHLAAEWADDLLEELLELNWILMMARDNRVL